MALGAIFAALNTMYAAVATRAQGNRHAARDRLRRHAGAGVGDDRVAGAAPRRRRARRVIAYLLFNNFSVSTLGENFTQVVFAFKVTPGAGGHRAGHRAGDRLLRRPAAGVACGADAGDDGVARGIAPGLSFATSTGRSNAACFLGLRTLP
jgi:hypothetical protein